MFLRRPSLPAIGDGLRRAVRAGTLGVRGLVFDPQDRVLLLEHTYVRGWHLPGGGVERGETAERALEREMLEEVGVVIAGAARLLSVHDNGRHFPGDLVLVYRIDRWRRSVATSRGEIARADFFAVDALPEGATPATRRRIEETALGRSPALTW